MASIPVRCPECGPMRVPPEQVRLVLNDASHEAQFVFLCGRCGQQVSAPAHKGIKKLLLAVLATDGAATPDDVPAEALEPHTDPPLSQDDVLDFMLGLREWPTAASSRYH